MKEMLAVLMAAVFAGATPVVSAADDPKGPDRTDKKQHRDHVGKKHMKADKPEKTEEKK